MVAIKSHQTDRTIKDPQKNMLAYLIYGTDEGRISENAALLAKNWSAKFGDGGDIIRIDERSLADNPDLLAIEIRSVSMFGGYNVVRANLSNRIRPDLVKELIGLKPQNLLIIEAGNLKPSSAMRKLFDKSKSAAALPCYPDEQRDISHLIDEEITGKGFKLSSPARKLLAQSLGTDRGISRQELIKLALYADGKENIELEDIQTTIGDSSQLAYDQLIALIMSGNAIQALAKLERLLASGQTSAGLMTMLGRHLARLYKVRAMIEGGKQSADAVASLRPPVHFKQKDALLQQVSRLNLESLKKAIHIVQETVARSRRSSNMELIGIERMILMLTRMTKNAR
ncbi:MAG: DNA polymerase III subunit delta [Hyphomicrobiaceae bacterium]|nr:DNA polymerase III subunit delta [Hyphomicrobiaceae bacterium]